MQLNKQDAVLLAAWVATVMIRIGLVIAWIGAFLSLVINLFWLTVSLSGFPDVPPSAGDDAGIVVILFVSLVALGLITGFFNRLAQIIRTVGKGDPFIPENARRLHWMACHALSAQVLAIVLAALAGWIGQDVAPRVIQALYGFWLGGLILSLTLFVLARVFRKGTEMREELEGTV